MNSKDEESFSSFAGYSVKDCLEIVSRIRIISRSRTERTQTGIHSSLFRGGGIDLADIREYEYGDDIRSMDWKVTARYRKPHVRIYHEERERAVYLMIDRSASSSFGTEISKDLKILEISATIIYSLLKDGDASGILLFTDEIERFIPARKGRRHSALAINTIISHKTASRRTDIKNAAEFLLSRLKRKSHIIIISDFDSPDFSEAISILGKKHDVQAIRVSDSHETELPDIGLVEISDPETGEQMMIDTSDRYFRERYREITEEYQRDLSQLFRKNRIPELNIITSDPYRDLHLKLSAFFRRAA
ncbi:DUF58 domain-containing protein [Methanoplanus endosymbiosus]|uniref:DUF58 domain-containing protein n=1 Tax=Methanoplanus endosymbiosus TaxID=33865 RepID=A0A9E7PLI9_9EURY|nr:DUF58 domain-containing protein [Methanoplanus endosymbiosus]UUX91577.1 DUF58 domain-containing protein [Methanoplanus endosymbiosus]